MDNSNDIMISQESVINLTRSSSRSSLDSEIIDLQYDSSPNNLYDNDGKLQSGQQNTHSDARSTSGSITPNPSQHQATPGQSGGAKNKKLFPQKLWDLINDERYNFCLRWSDDGQLVYLNRDQFEEFYLKTSENQFHTQKAISFVRQMNMYGFRKVDDCFYENDNFKRGNEHLLKKMIRKHPNKNTSNNLDLAPFLYQARLQQQAASNIIKNNSTTTTNTMSSPNVTNLSLNNGSTTTTTTGNTSLMDCRQRQSSTPYDKARESLLASHANLTQANLRLQQQVAGADKSTDDSLSSIGEYCYSVASSRGDDPSASPAGQIDLSNNEHVNASDGVRELQALQQQQQQRQLLEFYSQIGANVFDQPQSIDHNQRGQISSLGSPMQQNQTPNQLASNPILNSFLVDNLGCNQQDVNARALYHNQGESALESIFKHQQQKQTSLNNQTDSMIDMNLSSGPSDQTPDMNAMYGALMSTFNASLRGSMLPIQNVDQSLDSDRLSKLQQILYQQILLSQATNGNLTLTPTHSPNHLSASNADAQFIQNLDTTTEAAVNYSRPAQKTRQDSTPKSILIKTGKAPSMSLPKVSSRRTWIPETARVNTRPVMDGRNLTIRASKDTLPPGQQRRDANKANRSFKRSVDSILDLNNNTNALREQEALVKRLKLEGNYAAVLNVERLVTESYAKGLVTRIAQTRDPNIDDEVLEEAARYTERFVETLFDTAQVIARHSYGSASASASSSGSGDVVNALDNNITQVDEMDASGERVDGDHLSINTHDLTSAVKLIPSKLLKILN